MSKPANTRLIGLFVMGAIALVVGLTLMFGGHSLFSNHKRYVAYFEGSVNGLNIGAAVKLKGVSIGRVTDIMVQYDMDLNRVFTPVITEIDLAKVMETFDSQPKRHQHPTLQELIDRGLRARLSVQSLVTNQLYVDINFLPDSTEHLVGDRSLGLPELPTIASSKDEIEKTLQQVAAEVRQIPIKETADAALFALQRVDQLLAKPETDATIENLNRTLLNLHQLIKHLDQKVDGLTADLGGAARQGQTLMRHLDERLPPLLVTSERTMGSLEMMTAPGSELSNTLKDLSDAARAIRTLTETLEHQPDSLVYGKSKREE